MSDYKPANTLGWLIRLRSLLGMRTIGASFPCLTTQDQISEALRVCDDKVRKFEAMMMEARVSLVAAGYPAPDEWLGVRVFGNTRLEEAEGGTWVHADRMIDAATAERLQMEISAAAIRVYAKMPEAQKVTAVASSPPPTDSVQLLAKQHDVLKLLAKSPTAMKAVDFAGEVSQKTASEALKELEQLGLVESLGARSGWRITPAGRTAIGD